MNFGHALNDYGVAKNRLSVEVLAQTNNEGSGSGSGGSSSGSGGSGYSCTVSVKCEECASRKCTGTINCYKFPNQGDESRAVCDATIINKCRKASDPDCSKED